MCLASAYPAGVMPDLDELLEGIKGNPDGSGFTIATNTGTLITEHAIGTPAGTSAKGWNLIDTEPQQRLAERFIMLRKRHPDGPALFHSRYATGGTEDVRGCHPYRVGGDARTVLAHNGVLFSVPDGDWRSDTRIFAEDIMPVYFPRFWKKKTFSAIAEYIGKGNKLIIITVNPSKIRGWVKPKATLHIINEDLGIWTEDGAWHSNNGYKVNRYKTTTYNTSYSTSYSTTHTADGSPRTNTYKPWWDQEADECGGYGGATGTDWTGKATGGSNWGRQLDPAEVDKIAKEGGEISTTKEISDEQWDTITSEITSTYDPKQWKCRVCRAIGEINETTMVCDVCKTCQDCMDDASNCQCYIPRRLERAGNDDHAIEQVESGYDIPEVPENYESD